MTTIFTNGKVMCADSKVVGRTIMYGNIKIKRINGELWGAAGYASFLRIMKEWVNDGAYAKDIEHDVSIIYLNNKGEIWVYEDNIAPLKIERGFHAIGSGAQQAMAAFEGGASPYQAVKIAMNYDIYTGGKIKTLRL